MLRWLIARTLAAIGVVIATVFACSAVIAVLLPKDAPKAGVVAGTVDLASDFGRRRAASAWSTVGR